LKAGALALALLLLLLLLLAGLREELCRAADALPAALAAPPAARLRLAAPAALEERPVST
jgi:hypothetical protein